MRATATRSQSSGVTIISIGRGCSRSRAMTRANNSDARDYLPSTERETSGTFATTTEPPPTRLERAFAGVDPLATALGSLAVWLAVSGRSVKRRAKRWELRARRAEAENQVRKTTRAIAGER